MTIASTIIAMASACLAIVATRLTARYTVPFVFRRFPFPAQSTAATSLAVNVLAFVLTFAITFCGLDRIWSAVAQTKPAPGQRKASETEKRPPAPLPANLPRQVPRPAVRVGDAYVYRNWYANQPETPWTNEREVLSVNDQIVMSSRSIGGPTPGTRMIRLTPEWNLLSSRDSMGGGSDYSPPLAYYAFPLHPGKRWRKTSTRTEVTTGASETLAVLGEVVGWETVTVPAGRFDGLKVVVRIQATNSLTGESGTSVDASWYVPAVRRSVKSTIMEKGVQRQVELIRFRHKD